MPFCPECGTEVGNAQFCPNCGTQQGGTFDRGTAPPPQTVRVTTGHKYDEMICLLLCCCLSPLAALIYYLLTEHPESQQYEKQQY